MSNVAELLNKIEQIADHPECQLKMYTEKGKKAIGCMYYAPEELIDAAGMIPFGVWGAETELSSVKSYFPSFICSILQTTLELGINGSFDQLSGMIIPANCDPLRTMGQNWKVAVPQVEFIPLVHPINRKTEAGRKFLMAEYRSIQKALERISGQTITPERLEHSIDMYNTYRQTMRDFVRAAVDHPDLITPAIRHKVIKAGYFTDKETYTQTVRALVEALSDVKEATWTGSKLLVTGILMDSPEIMDVLEENHVAIVADDLAQETRQFRSNVPKEGESPMQRLVNYWSEMEGCSLLYDPQKKRGDMIIETVKNTGADGVLFLMMKFCDPEEFDYPIIKKQLEQANIPQIYVEFEQNAIDKEQIRTRIQAFNEMIHV
ncbi:MAG: 2-hydroxyacyl-CoA dehydratase family protein [Sporolactobacillus sp.]